MIDQRSTVRSIVIGAVLVQLITLACMAIVGLALHSIGVV